MIASLFLCSQGELFIHSLFRLHQAYIAQHHCENRFNPEVECNGKCFLKKRIDESEQRQHDHNTTPVSAPVLVFLPAADVPEVTWPAEESLRYASCQAQHELPGHGRALERPPRVS